jgi:hypothetical protein
MDYIGLLSFLYSFQGKEASRRGVAPQANAGEILADVSLDNLEYNKGSLEIKELKYETHEICLDCGSFTFLRPGVLTD